MGTKEWAAVGFLVVMAVLLSLLPAAHDFEIANLTISLLLETAWAVILVYAIFRLRRRPTIGSGTELDAGIWGYIWRSLCAKYIAFFSAMLIIVMADPKLPVPSVANTVLGMGIAISLTPIVCWGLFSLDRRSQVVWLLSTIRGA